MLVVLGCGVFAAMAMRVNTSITAFAVADDDARLGPWIGRLATTDPARTMIVSFGGESLAVAKQGAMRFAAALAEHPELATIRTGPEPEIGERLFDALHPRRFRFVDRDPTAVAGHFDDASLAAAAQRLRDALGRPTGTAIKRLAPRDPWLLFVAHTEAIRAGFGDGLAVEDGQFVTPDRSHAIVLLTTRHGPFEGAHQGPLDDAIEAARADIVAALGVSVERSALHRFAVQAERTIRAEVQWLSVVSGLGVAVMLLLAFGRVGALVLALLPMLAGVVVATAVTLAAFGAIHGLTLAFGTTLVGVCVDYPVHLMAQHLRASDRDAPLVRVWPALVLGAATTVSGFAALAVFGLPGVREMGLFAAVGVAAALGVTRFVVAPLLPRMRPGAVVGRSARWIEWGIDALARRRVAVTAVAAVAFAIALCGWTRAVWVDDARALTTALPGISDEDGRVRARIGGHAVGRVLIAEGADVDDAAAVQDRLWLRLGSPRVRSSAALVWSRATQDANLAAVRAISDLGPRTRAALGAVGFVPEAFAALDTQGRDDPGPLDHAALEAAGLGALLRPFVVEFDDRVALLSYVGEGDTAALVAAAAEVDGADYFDQAAFTERLYAEHRRGSLLAVGLGLLAIVVVLAARYRSAALVAAALLPAVLAAAATLGVLAWCGVSLQLLHLVGCMLVLSMGVDYGVFLVETRDSPSERGTAALGVAISSATTVVAFGVLGASSNPALAALGITTAMGVALAAAAAPVCLALVGTRRDRSDDDSRRECPPDGPPHRPRRGSAPQRLRRGVPHCGVRSGG